MYRIACVEDSPNEFELLAQSIERFKAENDLDLRVTHFSNAERFLESFACQYDIIFLDIALPEMSGMALAAAIRKTDTTVPIIFVTSLAQFAVNGYEVGAFDFIVKPVVYGDFSFKMKRLMQHMATSSVAKIIISSSSQKTVLVSNEIYYVEIIGHTIIYHTSKGNFETYDTIPVNARNSLRWLCAVDLDNNGYLDIVAPRGAGRTLVLRGGPEGFSMERSFGEVISLYLPCRTALVLCRESFA